MVDITEWIVVCHDLHVAFGPFESQRHAEMLALKSTIISMERGTDCVFESVPLVKKGDPEAAEDPEHRGYL